MTITITTKDETEARRLLKATSMACVLFEITHNMRKGVEHHIDATESADADYAIEYMMSRIYSLMDEHGVDINDIIE